VKRSTFSSRPSATALNLQRSGTAVDFIYSNNLLRKLPAVRDMIPLTAPSIAAPTFGLNLGDADFVDLYNESGSAYLSNPNISVTGDQQRQTCKCHQARNVKRNI
jgi:hypothetical protein